MTYEWTVTRHLPDGETTLGTLDTSNGATCYTLERTSLEIPQGRYPLTLTQSARAKRGELWAPGSDFKLPLINDVPERSGIRMHAGNTSHDSIGCILLGADVVGLTLGHSRPSVTRIVNLLQQAESNGDRVFLTVTSNDHIPNWTKR